MNEIETKLQEFMENEALSCSMDFGCITPLYVYRMLGGLFTIEEIERAMEEVRELTMEEVRELTMEEGRRKMEEG